MDMTNPTPTELAEFRAKARLASSMPEIETELDKMRHVLTNKVYGAIRGGTLTPERAMAYWLEMFSYDQLERRLKGQAAEAEVAIERS